MYSQKKISFMLCFLLTITILFSGCNGSNQNLGNNGVLTSNEKSLEVNLIKSGYKETSVREFIFEVENLGDTGIFLNYALNSNSISYDVWLEDYGGFRHDVIIDGVYTRLSDGSYKNNNNNVGGGNIRLYPKEKILIGCLFLPRKADIDKLKVKTILHFSVDGKSEKTWDVTPLFA